jgi:uncharacterized protein
VIGTKKLKRPNMNSAVGKLDIVDFETQYPQSEEWIDFGAVGEKEIWQCVKYILLTSIRSVPLDREFGMDFSMVDRPKPVAKLVYVQEVAMKITLYERRAEFDDVIFRGEDSIEGNLDPEVLIHLLVTT